MTRSEPLLWPRLLLGVAILYAVLALSAEALGSTRGEAGLIVGALTLGAALALDRLFFTGAFRESWRTLGLGAAHPRGLWAAALVAICLGALLPVAAAASGATLSLRADWLWLAIGILAQAGLAEELTFRGFLYGHIRRGRPFWRAVLLSIAPFALVHLVMFLTLPLPIAAASLALSVVLCAPLAHLYELGGRTIWAPVLVHAVIQGALKLVDIGGDAALLPLIWIGASATVPCLAFLWRRAPG